MRVDAEDARRMRRGASGQRETNGNGIVIGMYLSSLNYISIEENQIR